MLNSLKNKISGFFSPQYYVVYRNESNETKTYKIGSINLYNSFGNKNSKRNNIGFKAYCYGRKQVRSFRHDRIISITKK